MDVCVQPQHEPWLVDRGKSAEAFPLVWDSAIVAETGKHHEFLSQKPDISAFFGIVFFLIRWGKLF